MSVLKRFSTTVVAHIDRLVGSIENHDAVIDAAIRNARQAAARATVRLERVRRDGERLRQRLDTLRANEQNWARRARACAAQNEDTALECLRRRNACTRQAGELTTALTRHVELEARLAADIQQAQHRVRDMSQQRNLMRSRQAAAEALTTIACMGEQFAVEVDDAFERWEIKVTEAELAADSRTPRDPLESGFADAEERAALKSELNELIAKEGSVDD